MKVLALDSSTPTRSVALWSGSEWIAKKEEATDSHSERLLSLIDEVLKGASLKVEDLDMIAVGRGPGTFTGIRVGLATAKALAYPFAHIKCVGISTLEAMAESHKSKAQVVGSTLDAGRGEVYAAFYDFGANKVILKESLISQKVLQEISAEISSLYVVTEVPLYLAKYVGDIAIGCREELPPTPVYLRRPAAQV